MEFVDYKCLESLLIEGVNLIATEGLIDGIKSLVGKLVGIIVGFFKTIARLFITAANKLKNRTKLTDKRANELKGEAITLGILESLVDNSSRCSIVMTEIIKKVVADINQGKKVGFNENKVDPNSIDPYIDKMHAHCNAYSETVDKYKSKNDWIISESSKNATIEKFNSSADKYNTLANRAEMILSTVKFPNAEQALGKECIIEINKSMSAITKDSSTMSSNIHAVIDIINKATIIDD